MKKHATRLGVGVAVMAPFAVAVVALAAAMDRWPVQVGWAFFGSVGVAIAYLVGAVVKFEKEG